jgi:hypothetical protein
VSARYKHVPVDWSQPQGRQPFLCSAHWDVRPLHGLQPPYVRILLTSLQHARRYDHSVPEKEKEGEEAASRELHSNTSFLCRFLYDNGSTILTSGLLKPQTAPDAAGPHFFLLCPAKDLVRHPADAPTGVVVLCDSGHCEDDWVFEVSARWAASLDAEAIARMAIRGGEHTLRTTH